MNNAYSITSYGYLSGGEEVHKIILNNTQGAEAEIITYGGTLTRLMCQDRHGNWDNIVLGLTSLEEYVANSAFLGALIGRYGNRIANAQYQQDGELIRLEHNEGNNILHGGAKGFDKVVWDFEPFANDSGVGVILTHTSPDGDMGFPGNLAVEAIYELKNDNSLELRFKATTDKSTVISLTHHPYFNLTGNGSILNHQLMVNADHITPANDQMIPTGELLPVADTPFDFRSSKAIGQDIEENHQQLTFGSGYDHNYVLNKDHNESLVAIASDPESGRQLEIHSSEPGVQFYSGNHLDEQRTGFCLEPQHFPDSPNKPQFPSTVLNPGEVFTSFIIYQVGLTND